MIFSVAFRASHLIKPRHFLRARCALPGNIPLRPSNFGLCFLSQFNNNYWSGLNSTEDHAVIIGERLRALREEKKFSQCDIEKKSGLLRCYVSRDENGHTVPSVET